MSSHACCGTNCLRFASPAEAIRRPEAHGTPGTMSKNQRIILPKSQWHPMIIAWEPDGTLDHCPRATMASHSHCFGAEGTPDHSPGATKAPWDHFPGAIRHPRITLLEPDGIPDHSPGARKALQDHSPEPGMALWRPDEAPEAKSFIHSSNLTSPEGYDRLWGAIDCPGRSHGGR